MKFIHTADLHIDSPLRGLEAYDGAPVERLRSATRQAFENLIRLALEQSVDFVLIAGDLFDGKWQDMRTGLWTAAQLRALDRATIPVFILQGNHDAASKVPHVIRWPANVQVFSAQKPETIVLDRLRVAVHGQGFLREKVTTDLAAQYPDRVANHFNIGVLHTSLTGNPDHDTYAPTTVATLLGRHYDYWALGHIHARSDPPLHESPFIGYCGNLQGRHIHEAGAKGCLLVSVEDQQLTQTEFVAVDTVRWQSVQVALDQGDDRAQLLTAVERQLAAAREAADGRLLAVRIVVGGACEAHREVAREATRATLLAEIRNRASDLADDLWVEKIVFQTRAPTDLALLRRGHDLLGHLLRTMQQTAADEQSLEGLAELLRPLRDKAAQELSEAGLDLEDPALLAEWLQQAEALLVARLTESDG